MNSFEAFKTYRALKLHFTNKKYDYFLYQGKSKATIQQFEKSRDKLWFGKLAKHHSPVDLIVANFAYRDVNWVGDLFDETGKNQHLELQRRQQSLTYLFQQDLANIESLVDVSRVSNNQTPKLLTMYRRGGIMLESICILDDIIKVVDYWDQKIEDTVLWPQIRMKIKKLQPFIDYDRDKFKALVKTKLNTQP